MPRALYQLLGVEPTAKRAEIDAGLTRRENQYGGPVRTGKHPDQRIVERIRKAHETLANPHTRAAYDPALARAARGAAPGTTGGRASWPTSTQGRARSRAPVSSSVPGAGKRVPGSPPGGRSFPPAALVAGAASPVGRPAVAPLAVLAPWLPIAALGLLAALCGAGTVLLWRYASDVDRRVVAHIGWALSILALAGSGFAIDAARTGSLLRSVP